MKNKKVREEMVPPNVLQRSRPTNSAETHPPDSLQIPPNKFLKVSYYVFLQRQTPTALKRKQSFLVGKSCDHSHGK